MTCPGLYTDVINKKACQCLCFLVCLEIRHAIKPTNYDRFTVENILIGCIMGPLVQQFQCAGTQRCRVMDVAIHGQNSPHHQTFTLEAASSRLYQRPFFSCCSPQAGGSEAWNHPRIPQENILSDNHQTWSDLHCPNPTSAMEHYVQPWTCFLIVLH